MIFHETLTDETIIRIAQIADQFHDRAYLEFDYKIEKNVIQNRFWPIAVLKMNGEDNNNFTEKLFFASSIVEKIMSLHHREGFILQRYVFSKGKSPSLIRCILNFRHFPQIAQEKVEKALAVMERADQYRRVDDTESQSSDEEDNLQKQLRQKKYSFLN